MSEPTGVVLVLDNRGNVVKEYCGVTDINESEGIFTVQMKDCAAFIPKTFILELYKESN